MVHQMHLYSLANASVYILSDSPQNRLNAMKMSHYYEYGEEDLIDSRNCANSTSKTLGILNEAVI